MKRLLIFVRNLPEWPNSSKTTFQEESIFLLIRTFDPVTVEVNVIHPDATN